MKTFSGLALLAVSLFLVSCTARFSQDTCVGPALRDVPGMEGQHFLKLIVPNDPRISPEERALFESEIPLTISHSGKGLYSATGLSDSATEALPLPLPDGKNLDA